MTTTVGDTKMRGHKIWEGSRPRSRSTDMPSGLARARHALGGPMAPCPWAPCAWLLSPSGDAQGSQGAGEGATARVWGEPRDTLQGRVTLWGEEGSLVGRGRSRESPARRAARCPPAPSGASSPLGPTGAVCGPSLGPKAPGADSGCGGTVRCPRPSVTRLLGSLGGGGARVTPAAQSAAGDGGDSRVEERRGVIADSGPAPAPVVSPATAAGGGHPDR